MAAVYPGSPLSYPVPAAQGQYSVQYKLDGGAWTDARVYLSIYGGTNASPYEPFTKYPSYPNTSMSFVSIPAHANAYVQLRVTKLQNAPFLASDHVSVRPSPKPVLAALAQDGTVNLSTVTAPDFSGEQFILWWDRDSQNGGGIQGLAFFLDPPYATPTGQNVKVIRSANDLTDPHLIDPTYDTLDFEGIVPIGGPGIEGPGAQVFSVPVNIKNVFLGAEAWVQGKLRFVQSGHGSVRRIYGPGVLDGSRFNYLWRQCRNAPASGHQIDGYQAISWDSSPAHSDTFAIDGPIVSDFNYTATDGLVNSVVNNMKIIGWNGNNDGLQMETGTIASNVFVRTGDDSLEMWGGSITVTNATVWQNAEGGVVNLGWLNRYPGDYDLIDGLYVVRTDWSTPTVTTFRTDPTDLLAHQNNAVIASLMSPGTMFGTVSPPVYRNIFVEDPPRVLFSLKILPPDTALSGLKAGEGATAIDLTLPSVVNLTLENVFTPASPLPIQNSIGFQTLPAGFTYEFPAGTTHTLATDYTLTGTMNIHLDNVMVKSSSGLWTPLTSANAMAVDQVTTNPPTLAVNYDLLPDLLISCTHIGNFLQGQSTAAYTILVENRGSGATNGAVSVANTLPSGLTGTAIDGPGWTCALPTLTCSRSDPMSPGAIYPPITITASVASNAASPAINRVSVSGGGSATATASDLTTVLAPFSDVSSSDAFLPAIDLMREYTITSGCEANPPLYCPNDSVTEAQMAVFVVRSIMGGDSFAYTSTPYFSDVPASNSYFPWIQKMQDLGIAVPCASNQFCPDAPVTRGIMAVLIIRGRYGVATPSSYPATPYFADVAPNHPYFPWIQKMKQLGITSGCTATTYCPDDPVTRGQMAVFIMRGEFNQLLPASTPVVAWVSPAGTSPGLTTLVTIAGQNTHFTSGMTQVNAGAGISVSNIGVMSGTTLTVQFVAAPGATLGPRSITVTTGDEEATLPNGFQVR
ncbi:MAG TPA: S-layer homology domain-containing protein [Bryobacteraceae bacterium]|nr:S-layer homology domain-containing protein [Bryobacteraceae bacterium]